jgi:glyoxylase-like metal-dependent hydrolase (beta-lactamase superfamily II)
LVRLDKKQEFLLAGDTCYTQELLNNDILPALLWSPSHLVQSVSRLRYAQKVKNIKIITGHDPEAWLTYKQAPDYYQSSGE